MAEQDLARINEGLAKIKQWLAKIKQWLAKQKILRQNILHSLEDIMFFAGLPLLVPVVCSISLGEPIWAPMLLSALLLILPGMLRILGDAYANYREEVSELLLKPPKGTSWKFRSLFKLDLLESLKKRGGLTRSEAITVAALSWVIVPLITTVPYLTQGIEPTNAIFDSMSGWTATGLSTIDQPEMLPDGFVLFRSFTQWIGGAGIVLFALLVMCPPGAGKLLLAEGRDGIAIGIRKTVEIIWTICIFFTILGILLFLLTGMGLFYSTNVAISAFSGGFEPSSLLVFSVEQKIVFILVTLAGATSFGLLWEMRDGKFNAILKHTEFKMMIFLIILFSAFLVLTSKDTIVDSVFDVTTSISGVGYQIHDMSFFSDLSKYVLVLMMISGACSGSATGAIKLWRTFAVVKSLENRIRSPFLPSRTVQVVKVNGRPLTASEIEDSGAYIFLYVFVLLAGAGAIMATGFSTIDSLFVTASAMGNVGLTTFNIYSSPFLTKWTLILCMYLGRIEILPSLVMLKYIKG